MSQEPEDHARPPAPRLPLPTPEEERAIRERLKAHHRRVSRRDKDAALRLKRPWWKLWGD